MVLPKELTTVTKTSKYLALSIFIILPILAFLIGVNYQGMIDDGSQPVPQSSSTVIQTKSVTPSVSPVLNDTTSWKTYTDNSYSFQYPFSWSLSTQASPDGKEVKLTYLENNQQYLLWVAQGGSSGPTSDNIKDETVNYGGRSFTRKTWLVSGKPIFISIIPDSAKPFNHIQISLPPTNTDKYLQIFNHILTSLKFSSQ